MYRTASAYAAFAATTVLVGLAVVVGAGACSAGGNPGGGGARRDAGGAGPGMDAGPDYDGGGTPPRVDAGFSGCDSIRREANNVIAPVDIIWVIDSSGSMDGEARLVQDNMNNFVVAISAASIDYRVVVITDPDFVTVPPPLGTDASHYRFVNHDVGSNEPLQALISQYPMYSDFLRPDAITHFVVVTDDESALAADSFQTMMTTLLGKPFYAHAIASPNETHPGCPVFCGAEDGCTGPGGDAADIGQEYINLTGATGSLFFSICTSDWGGLFGALSAAIAVGGTIPCAFEIPAPPDGMTFDRMRVNVAYTAGGTTDPTYFPYVADSGSCTGAGGWYYDNPTTPRQVLLCPASCDLVGMDMMMGSVDVAFGCETIIF